MTQQPQFQRITLSELSDLVELEVQAQIATGGDFTAYTITQILRQKNPTLLILHDVVRQLVNESMTPLPGGYATDWRTYGGGDIALTYTKNPTPKPDVLPPSQNPIQKLIGIAVNWGKKDANTP